MASKNASCLGLFGAAFYQTIEGTLDALVAERDTELGAHVLGDGAIAHAPCPKRLHLGECSLLVLARAALNKSSRRAPVCRSSRIVARARCSFSSGTNAPSSSICQPKGRSPPRCCPVRL